MLRDNGYYSMRNPGAKVLVVFFYKPMADYASNTVKQVKMRTINICFLEFLFKSEINNV